MKEIVISCLNNIRNILYDVYEDERSFNEGSLNDKEYNSIIFLLSRIEEVVLNDKR